jgi:hypothetical protein
LVSLEGVARLRSAALTDGTTRIMRPSWLRLPSNLGSSAVPSYAALR